MKVKSIRFEDGLLAGVQVLSVITGLKPSVVFRQLMKEALANKGLELEHLSRVSDRILKSYNYPSLIETLEELANSPELTDEEKEYWLELRKRIITKAFLGSGPYEILSKGFL